MSASSDRVIGWGPRSLRTRITALCGVIIALCLTTYSIAVGISYASHVEAELNRAAQEDLELAIRAILVDAGGVPSWPGTFLWKEVKEEEGGGHWIEVWSASGRRVLAAGTSRDPDFGPPDETSLGKGARTVQLPAGPFRVICERVALSGSRFVVRAAISEFSARREIRSLWRELALLSLAVFALGAFGGWLLARRALGPLSRMAEHARRITAEQLHDHLPADDAGTELNQLRDAFNETLGRLERSFDGLRTFSAHASHELRTPLTAIRSVGEVGLSRPRSDAEYREVIGTMLEEVDRLARLMDALLSMARADAGAARLQIERVELASLARDVVERLAVLAEERGQRLEVRAEGTAAVMGDRLALRQALQNLVHNAIKYAGRGTHIDLRVHGDEAAAIVEVRDEGPGIPLELRARIFERFYRGNGAYARDREGVGLGLSIVKATAEAHGGRIDLETEVGVGSTFRLVIPRSGFPLS